MFFSLISLYLIVLQDYIRTTHMKQGIPQQPGNRQIAYLIAFFPQLLCFQKWKCQCESKISICFAWSPFYFRIINLFLENEWNAHKNIFLSQFIIKISARTLNIYLNDAWTVRTNQSRFRLTNQFMFDLDHVLLGDSFSNTNNQRYFCIYCFNNGRSSKGRRNIDRGGISTCLFSSLKNNKFKFKLMVIFYTKIKFLPLSQIFIFFGSKLSNVVMAIFDMDPRKKCQFCTGPSNNCL